MSTRESCVKNKIIKKRAFTDTSVLRLTEIAHHLCLFVSELTANGEGASMLLKRFVLVRDGAAKRSGTPSK